MVKIIPHLTEIQLANDFSNVISDKISMGEVRWQKRLFVIAKI